MKTMGFEMATDVIAAFGTNDVFVIAEKLGLSLVYERWHPVTVGEFDLKAKKITVNQNAVLPFEKIIAHELGHYFLGQNGINGEESICDDFAEKLLSR